MDTNQPTLEQIESNKEKIREHWDHCRNVRQAAEKLWNKLCSIGEFELARRLAQRASCHDSSKFSGIEFEFLTGEQTKENLMLAVKEHRSNNDHHPEFYNGGIKDMPDEAIAEMVCDWFARSAEKGTCLRAWIKESAMDHFKFTPQTIIHKKIKKFVDLLLDEPFKKL